MGGKGKPDAEDTGQWLAPMRALGAASRAAADESCVVQEAVRSLRDHEVKGPRLGRALVVDNEPAVADAVKRQVVALRRFGDVHTAFSGMAAIDELNTHYFEVAVIDLRLGAGPDGEAVARVAKLKPGTGVIVYSGYLSRAEIAQRGERLGAAWLSKPFSPEELEAALGRALRLAGGGDTR